MTLVFCSSADILPLRSHVYYNSLLFILTLIYEIFTFQICQKSELEGFTSPIDGSLKEISGCAKS